MNIKENYQQYVSRYASEVTALKRKNTGFITGELLAFGGILAFLICYFALDGDTQNYLMGAASFGFAQGLSGRNQGFGGRFLTFRDGRLLSESTASLFLRPRCLRQEFAV